MQTIVLATQKGGSGKTTLAIGLALAAIQAGHTVRLIETDSQGTLSNWQSRRPYAEPIVEPVYAAGDVEQRLQSLGRDGVTLTIIDTAGGVSAATNSAIRHADFCLIPARPSIADIEATASTLSVIRAWNKPFAFILNQTPIRGQRLTTAANALGEEAARDISGVVAPPSSRRRLKRQRSSPDLAIRSTPTAAARPLQKKERAVAFTSGTLGTRRWNGRSGRSAARCRYNVGSGTARLRGHRLETSAGNSRARRRSGDGR